MSFNLCLVNKKLGYDGMDRISIESFNLCLVNKKRNKRYVEFLKALIVSIYV